MRALGLGFPVATESNREKKEDKNCSVGIFSAPPLSSSAWKNHLLMLPGKISFEKKILLPNISTC